MNNPILSIVIPTKNRYETLKVIVDYLLAWEFDCFELIVHDNSDISSSFPSLIEATQDRRLKYIRVKESLSAVENCDRAIRTAEGEYVTFIGDDDGVTKRIIDAVYWMKNNGVDAAYCSKACYTWPDMKHAIAVNKCLNGLLLGGQRSGRITFLNPAVELKKVLKSGAQLMGCVPRVYHGIVSAKVLEDTYEKLGTYFPGAVPDMSNAIAINKNISRFALISAPIIVSGQSSKSMSGRNSVRQHQGDIKDESTLPSETTSRWSISVPKYWSAPTIWAQTALESLDAVGCNALAKHFNYPAMFANCIAYSNYKYYPLVFKTMRDGRTLWQLIVLSILVIGHFSLIFFKRLFIFAFKFIAPPRGRKFETIADSLRHLDLEQVDLKFVQRD
jgi:glycosyltransferase involved in cell wall biosynthesis